MSPQKRAPANIIHIIRAYGSFTTISFGAPEKCVEYSVHWGNTQQKYSMGNDTISQKLVAWVFGVFYLIGDLQNKNTNMRP